MGQCLCKSTSPPEEEMEEVELEEINEAPIPPPPRALPPKMVALIKSKAGTQPRQGFYEDVANSYIRIVMDLRKRALRLEVLLKDFEPHRSPADGNINVLPFRIGIQNLGSAYEDFLRVSSVKVDDYVQKRKDMASEGFKDWFIMKEVVDVMFREKCINLREMRRMVQVQKDHAEQLLQDVVDSKIPPRQERNKLVDNLSTQ